MAKMILVKSSNAEGQEKGTNYQDIVRNLYCKIETKFRKNMVVIEVAFSWQSRQMVILFSHELTTSDCVFQLYF